MELERFTLEELLLSALKSEVDSRDIYKKIAASVSNALLKDKKESTFLFHYGNGALSAPQTGKGKH